MVNKKSALDWVVERCGVSIDKASQIVNDFNNMAEEMGDPQYILHLILRVITVTTSSAYPPTGSVASKAAAYMSLLMRRSIAVLR